MNEPFESVIASLIWENDEGIECENTVFAEVQSITQSEFFKCAENGFRPDGKICVWTSEYDNEQTVEFNGYRYAVYRTYAKRDGKTELFLKDKTGIRK